MKKTFITGILIGILVNCHILASIPVQIGVVANQSVGDENTVFLTLMQGSDTSTTFTDISVGGVDSPRTITANGNAEVSTDINDPFGNNVGVGYFDAAPSYLSFPDSEDVNFSNNDFTIEFWVYRNSLGNDDRLYSHMNTSNSDYCIESWITTGNHIAVLYSTNGTS